MKNTAIENFCDWGIVYSLCALIFALPASIALVDSFAALVILFYFLKKINRIVTDWPLNASHLNLLGKILFIWKGLAPPKNILTVPLQFLTLAVFISVLFSQYPMLSLAAFFGKFIKCVLLYFSFIEAYSDEKRIRVFLRFFFLSALVTALYGVIEHYAGMDIFKNHLISSGRVNAFFFSANELGPYLLPVIGLVAQCLYTAIVRNKFWALSGALTLFLILLLSCLCWTYSRSSWVGFLVIVFVMWSLDKRKALLAGALLIVFIFIFLPSLNHVRHMNMINDNGNVNVTIPLVKGNKVGNIPIESTYQGDKPIYEDAGSGRLTFWKKAISVIRSSPIVGTGLNTYIRIIKRNPDKKTWWYAHNSYLQMAAETGFLGLSCFLWMLFALLRHGLNYCNQIKDLWPRTFLQGTLSGLFGFLAQSFFDNTFFTVQLVVLLWLMIGLIVALTRLNPTSEFEVV